MVAPDQWRPRGAAAPRAFSALAMALQPMPPVRGEVEDLADHGHVLLVREREHPVLAAVLVGDLLDAVAERDAPAVDVPALGVLAHALDGLGREVHRVELVDDLDHPLVEEALGGLGVEVLGDRLDGDAVLAEQALEEDGLLAVPAEPVELVDEDGVHAVLPAVADHGAEAGALVGGGVGGLALVDELGDDAVVGALLDPAVEELALRGDGDVLLGLLLGRDAAVGDDVEHGELRAGRRDRARARLAPQCNKGASEGACQVQRTWCDESAFMAGNSGRRRIGGEARGASRT
jgi:hypothetical protein